MLSSQSSLDNKSGLAQTMAHAYYYTILYYYYATTAVRYARPGQAAAIDRRDAAELLPKLYGYITIGTPSGCCAGWY